MNLDAFKQIGVNRNDVIEYTSRNPEYVKATRLGYYRELIEELSEMWSKGRPEPPFIVVADFKDKNGCPRNQRDVPLEDVLYLWVIGKSNLI